MVLLGTGTPRTESGRAGPATAVIAEGVPYLFDFGPGVGARVSRAHETGIEGMAMSNLTTAFLTHHHSDHTSGLPDLYLTSWMFQRRTPLHVYGPLGTEAMCRALVEAYALDIAKRTFNEPHAPGGHLMVGHDIVPGNVFQDDLVSVEAFDVPHGEWTAAHGPHPTLGFRITSDDRCVVISGDTTWHRAMPRLYADADILVHEVFSSRGLETHTKEWQSYHQNSHTAAAELGRVAADVRPGVLALTHQLLWSASPADMLDELKSEYDGAVVYGTDLTVL